MSAAQPSPRFPFLRRWRRVMWSGLALVLLLSGWLQFWPIPYDPQAWVPQPNLGFTGIFTVNQQLTAITSPTSVVGEGPEVIAFSADGSFCTGLVDGRIMPASGPGALCPA